MKKSMKRKGDGFGKKLGMSIVAVGLLGWGAFALADSKGAFDNPTINTGVASPLARPVTITTFDIESEADTVQDILVLDEEGNADVVLASGTANSVNFIEGKSYVAYVLDSATYGSDATLDVDMNGVVAEGTGFEFTVPTGAYNLRLGTNLISDYTLKAKNNDDGADLFALLSSGYIVEDAITFSSTADAVEGAVIDTTGDIIDVEFTMKPSEREAVANDNGIMFVVSASNDVFENLEMSFEGAGLTQLSQETLEEDYSKVTYDAFKNKKVFVVDASKVMVRGDEYVFNFNADVIEGESIAEDVVIDAYTLGNIKSGRFAKLSALNSGETALHPDTHKVITLNLVA